MLAVGLSYMAFYVEICFLYYHFASVFSICGCWNNKQLENKTEEHFIYKSVKKE